MLSENRADDDRILLPNLAADGRTDVAMWVQEAIFGHRYIEEQRPYMLVLETLAICRALQIGDDGKSYSDLRIFKHDAATDTEHEAITVPITRSAPFRYIVFRDRSLEQIAADASISPDERLEAWISALNKGFRSDVRNISVTFDYLRKRFSDRFDDVLQAVRILRGLELDVINDRRWTSCFLTPRGPDLLLQDVDLKFVADRRFFGRGGEMVYLMLSRSKHATELAQIINDQFFDPSDPMNQIALKLAAPILDRTPGGQIGYLPLAEHHSYDRLANDWKAILTLSDLPPPQKFEPLFRITALNLVRYFGERAHTVSGNSTLDPIPLDMMGGQDINLRDVSKSYLRRHRQVIEDAVEAFIRGRVQAMPSWQSAMSHLDLSVRSDLAIESIRKGFQANKFASDSEGNREPEAWLSQFIADSKKRSRNNVATLIEPLGKHGGFIVGRRGAGTWFCASDELLEALVLAVVDRPMTISEFTAEIYERYGLVVGPKESRAAFAHPPCDISSFEDNLRAAEQRLTGLGYVKRLSDDCAFVSNVYRQDT